LNAARPLISYGDTTLRPVSSPDESSNNLHHINDLELYHSIRRNQNNTTKWVVS